MYQPVFSRKALFIALIILSFFACKKDVAYSNIRDSRSAIKAAAIVTSSVTDADLSVNPFPFKLIVPCANNGLGEEIIPQGTIRLLSVLTVTGNKFTLKMQYTPLHVTSIGTVTGDIYNAAGVNEMTQNGSFVNGSNEFTANNIFFNIGREGAPHWKLKVTTHVTVNADGTVTSAIDKIDTSCD